MFRGDRMSDIDNSTTIQQKKSYIIRLTISFAIFFEFSQAALLSAPKWWIPDGLPYFSVKYGTIASRTSRPIIVVAALSK
jgi:hypothetical protein